jgi:soluble lytic murein transglycosylase-like protein
MRIRVLSGLLLASAALAGCTTGDMGTGLPGVASVVPTPRPDTETASASTESHGKLDRLIAAYSAAYEVPASLIHRVIKRESNYDPKAYHAGNYGLMQIRYRTAKGMGYDGSPHGLLDPATNLKYAVKYLKGAWMVAGGSESRADRLYQRGYYYDAKRKGMLDEVGWEGSALASANPDEEAARPGPTVAAASLESTQPLAEPQAATPTVAAEPASSRFGEPAASRAAPVVTASAPATAIGYAGASPTAGEIALPGVMQAPPERPRL